MNMMWRMLACGTLLVLATSAGAQGTTAKPPVIAPEDVSPPETQCGEQSLSACTSQRVQELRRYREAMRRAAAVTASGSGVTSVEDARRVGNYDRWLTDIANNAEQIAQRGQAVQQLRGASARAPAMQFHQQYLAFIARLRKESPLHDTSAGLMKKKRAVLVNMLGGAQ